LVLIAFNWGSDQERSYYIKVLSSKTPCFEALNACFYRQKWLFKKTGGRRSEGNSSYVTDFSSRLESVMTSGIFSTHSSLELKCVNFRDYRMVIL